MEVCGFLMFTPGVHGNWQHNADPTFRWSVSCTAQIFHPKCLWPLPWSHNSQQVYRSVRALAALGAYLGISSLILRMKSDFSTHPLQDSPHSSKIFFRSFTFNFLRSTELRSTCLSRRWKTHLMTCSIFWFWDGQDAWTNNGYDMVTHAYWSTTKQKQ